MYIFQAVRLFNVLPMNSVYMMMMILWWYINEYAEEDYYFCKLAPTTHTPHIFSAPMYRKQCPLRKFSAQHSPTAAQSPFSIVAFLMNKTLLSYCLHTQYIMEKLQINLPPPPHTATLVCMILLPMNGKTAHNKLRQEYWQFLIIKTAFLTL